MSKQPEFLERPVCRAIFEVLADHGGEARFVGGAVRDFLIGKPTDDIDIAVNRPIETVADWLRAAGISVYETGIAHGTITVRFAAQSVEVTQTRIDIETDGRHARVAATDDWQADAARRDFTINALYMDLGGGVYDPLGGQADLQAGRLDFIGDPDLRITEDYLRILRAFRLVAEHPELHLTKRSLEATTRHLNGLQQLSGERITTEWMRLLAGVNWRVALRLACGAGLYKALLGGGGITADLSAPLADKLNALGRLAWLLGPTTAIFPEWLRLSRRDYDTLQRYVFVRLNAPKSGKANANRLLTGDDWQQVAYWFYPDGALAIYVMLYCLWENQPIDQGRLQRLIGFTPPIFPIRGGDLLEHGMRPGPELGNILKKLEHIWVDSDFSLNRAELLALLAEEKNLMSGEPQK